MVDPDLVLLFRGLGLALTEAPHATLGFLAKKHGVESEVAERVAE